VLLFKTQLSEDCLHLAVYVPSGLTRKINTETGSYYKLIDNINNANLPVMFFLHGGAFFNGGSMVTLYDGRFISEKGDVIVVVTNYRYAGRVLNDVSLLKVSCFCQHTNNGHLLASQSVS